MMPRVAAHRGFSAAYPENTLPAFAAARRPGVIAVEFDVQLSRDDVPMVIHDATLERIGQGARRIGEVDAAELRGTDAGSWRDPAYAGAGIPRLADVLEAIPDREVWIEIKVYAGDAASGRARRTVERVERVVAEAGAGGRAHVLCFHRPTLDRTELPRVWNLEEPVTDPGALRGIQAVDIDIDRLTEVFARQVREAGLALMCYTVNSPGQLERAVACGVDAIITDDPPWALAELLALGEQ